MSPTLGAFDWLNGLLIVAFLFISVVMILIVLIQRPQGGGLSGAFGSAAGSGQTAFGARTGDALTIATVGIFVVFLVTSAVLNHTIRPPKAAKPSASVTAPAGNTPAAAPQAAPGGAAPSPAAAAGEGARPNAADVADPALAATGQPPATNPTPPPAPEQPAPASPPAPTP